MRAQAKHRDGGLDDHRHVNANAITLFDTPSMRKALPKLVYKPARAKLPIGDVLVLGRVVPLPNDGGFSSPRAHRGGDRGS